MIGAILGFILGVIVTAGFLIIAARQGIRAAINAL